eukprot:363869-Chlamydomonas_euryale.AAC.36
MKVSVLEVTLGTQQFACEARATDSRSDLPQIRTVAGIADAHKVNVKILIQRLDVDLVTVTQHWHRILLHAQVSGQHHRHRQKKGQSEALPLTDMNVATEN